MYYSSPIDWLFNAYFVILLVRVLMSWLPMSAGRGRGVATVGRFVYALTEPLLRPIRRLLRPYQQNLPFDFSPLLLMVALSVVETMLHNVIG